MRDWNAVRFDGDGSKPHVESYFAKANDPSGELAVWLKATVLSRGRPRDGALAEPVAEGWAIVFDRRGGRSKHVAVKHVLPFSRASFSPVGLGVSWAHPTRDGERFSLAPTGEGGCAFSGRIGTGTRAIAFELTLRPERVGGAPLVPLPARALYEAGFPKQKLVSPVGSATVDGFVEVDGEPRIELASWRGMQGHNWGRGHSDEYGWCHVNAWDEGEAAGEPIVVEAGTARLGLALPLLGPRLSPPLSTVVVRLGDRDVAWNGPLDIVRTKVELSTTRYALVASSRAGTFEAELIAPREDVVGLLYENPSGPPTYCLNTKLATARVRIALAGEPERRLATRRAALELGTKDPSHGLRVYV